MLLILPREVTPGTEALPGRQSAKGRSSNPWEVALRAEFQWAAGGGQPWMGLRSRRWPR